MAAVHTKQAALVAIGHAGLCLMGYRGEGFRRMILDAADDLRNPIRHFPIESLPREVGFYIWRGDVAIETETRVVNAYASSETREYREYTLKGAFEPATASEVLGHVGVEDPPLVELPPPPRVTMTPGQAANAILREYDARLASDPLWFGVNADAWARKVFASNMATATNLVDQLKLARSREGQEAWQIVRDLLVNGPEQSIKVVTGRARDWWLDRLVAEEPSHG